MESLFSYESGQHADDGSALFVRNLVEFFVDFVGMVDDDADRMAGLEGIETHHVLQIFRHELLMPFETRFHLYTVYFAKSK